MALELSNTSQLPPQFKKYDLDPHFAARVGVFLSKIELFEGVESSSTLFEQFIERSPASSELLEKVHSNLTPIQDSKWLVDRGIKDFPGIFTLDYSLFTEQELLDLNVIPADHIVSQFGKRPVEGLVFPDLRSGKLFGICVRNLSRDLPFTAAAKYTFSNFDHFLYGLDGVCGPVAICEGVFDKLALDSIGKQAVALGSAYPSCWQLACIERRGKGVEIYMDNDFYGWCGAYAIAKVFRKKYVWLSDHKDPAETIFEKKEPETFSKFPIGELEKKISKEIPLHNKRVRDLDKDNLHLFRTLKYN